MLRHWRQLVRPGSRCASGCPSGACRQVLCRWERSARPCKSRAFQARLCLVRLMPLWALPVPHRRRPSLHHHTCRQAFEDKGVKSMYPWQAAALECGGQVSHRCVCCTLCSGQCSAWSACLCAHVPSI